MNHDYLLNFTALDESAFTALMRHLGYGAAACYRLENQKLTFFFGTIPVASTQWPAVVTVDNSNYTDNQDRGLPLGWVKQKAAVSSRKIWPKGTNIYFPEQESNSTKIVLVVLPLDKKRHPKMGDIDGPLEVVLRRISMWMNTAETRNFLNETAFSEHVRRLSLEMQALINHELRTPLSIIDGYALQMEKGDFQAIIHEQAQAAIKSIEKLCLVLGSGFNDQHGAVQLQPLDLGALVRQICSGLEAVDGPVSVLGKKPKFSIAQPRNEQPIMINGAEKLVERALWEVMHNAVIHSQQGNVRITLYINDDTAVLDIEDDGNGVPVGSEDLIFMRFFQGPNQMRVRRSRRGLGLGLFLARHIAELHMGQLTFIRQSNRGSVFRFMWPLVETTSSSGSGGRFKTAG